jgi:hypothetical protein
MSSTGLDPVDEYNSGTTVLQMLKALLQKEIGKFRVM